MIQQSTGKKHSRLLWSIFFYFVLFVYLSLVTDQPVVNTQVESVNTNDNDEQIIIESGVCSDETPVMNFTAGPFVTRRNPTAEISSMLSSLYLSDSDDEETSDEVDEESCVLNVNVVQIMQSDIMKRKVDLLALDTKVQSV